MASPMRNLKRCVDGLERFATTHPFITLMIAVPVWLLAAAITQP
jgi:hypothetical protein